MELFNHTIVAPATPRGGAIALVRVSGPDAIACVDPCFQGRTPLSAAAGYSLHYGSICEPDGTLIDDVVVSVFRAPHSYTGENAVEIACHGSDYIVSRLLALLLRNGAKMAMPGEFTQRAFLNGKMDLSQAEAVADLIGAQTAAAHRIALRQLKGGFSDELAVMRVELLHIASLMELELDFSEEDVEFADRVRLRELVAVVLSHIERLADSFRLGNAIKNGVPVAIVGNTNAGKSTLLNAMVGEERAIVSDIPGTTRDTIEETFTLGGVLFRFIDTAGLRESDDAIERIGIDRAYEKLAAAQLVLVLLDLTAPQPEWLASAQAIAQRATGDQQLFFLLNKADAVSDEAVASARDALSPFLLPGRHCFSLSAKTRSGLDALEQALAAAWQDLDIASETTLVTNARHAEALRHAAAALRRLEEGIGNASTPALPTDLLAQDLREALYHLGSIVGEVSNNEILENIFKHFCIGK